jgi:hypothetical protein
LKGSQRLHERLQIIAHQVELCAQHVPSCTNLSIVGGVHRDFRRRKFEDQPTSAGINAMKLENIAKKRTVGIRILAEEENMSAGNHGASLSSGAVGPA